MRTLIFLIALTCPVWAATCTSYTGSEDPAYRNHAGEYINSQGQPLDETMCAAPPHYRYGTVIRFTPREGDSFTRIVADRGSAIQGNHFDIYWDTRRKMRNFGTQICDVEIVDSPLSTKGRRIKVGSCANLHFGPRSMHLAQSSKRSNDGHPKQAEMFANDVDNRHAPG